MKYILYRIEIGEIIYVGSCSAWRKKKTAKSGIVDGFPIRCTEHKMELKNNKHYNRTLQEAYNKDPNPIFVQIRYFDANNIRTRQLEEEKEMRRRLYNKKTIANVHRFDNNGKGITQR